MISDTIKIYPINVDEGTKPTSEEIMRMLTGQTKKMSDLRGQRVCPLFLLQGDEVDMKTGELKHISVMLMTDGSLYGTASDSFANTITKMLQACEYVGTRLKSFLISEVGGKQGKYIVAEY